MAQQGIAKHPGDVGGWCLGERLTKKSELLKLSWRGSSWNWRRIWSSNHWNVKLVLIFHEAYLFGGPFFGGVSTVFPSGDVAPIWQTEWSTKINHSYFAIMSSLKKPNKNRLPFATNRLPCEPASPLRSCDFFCTLCELSRSRLSHGTKKQPHFHHFLQGSSACHDQDSHHGN